MIKEGKSMNSLLLVTLLITFSIPAMADEKILLNSTYTDSPPTIDGFLNSGEWTNGVNITLNGFYNPNHTKKGILYLMNDNLSIYIALVVPDSTLDSSMDYAMSDFDQGNDHYPTTNGEDALDYNSLSQGYNDAYWDGYWWARDVDNNGISHGSGNRLYSGGKYVYEFSKPLNSGEDKDISLAPGNVIGFRIETWDQSEMEYYRFPENTVDSDTLRWNEWADLTIGNRTTGCLMKGDSTPCNGKVDDFELLAYINLWVQNTVSDFDLLDAIKNWAI